MNNQTYNGWKGNGDKARAYATWRVVLEIFDGDYAHHQAMESDTLQEAIERVSPEALEEFVEMVTFENIPEAERAEFGADLMIGYAQSFLSDVNYYEISEHMINELEENATEWGLEIDEEKAA